MIFSEVFEEACDCTVHKTDSIEEATDLIQKNKYDLISLDYSMPIMSGADLAKKIRTEGVNQLTPIVFITGYLMDCMKDAKDLDNVSFIEKKNIYDELVPLIMSNLEPSK